MNKGEFGRRPDEEWRPAPGYEGCYEVSSIGRVRSLRFNPAKVIWQGRDNDGYPYVRLWKDRQLGTSKVHRLVCRAFHGEPRPVHREVAHLDGNRENCCSDNLKWVSKVENHFHKRLHGTHQAGERHPRAKLTEAMVAEIRGRPSETATSLAREFGVARTTIADIRTGRRWKQSIRRRGAL